MARPFGCGGCEERWGGEAACHCSRCHRTFSSLRQFDLHWFRGEGDRFTCLDPEIEEYVDQNGIGHSFSKNGRGYWLLTRDLEAAKKRLWGASESK